MVASRHQGPGAGGIAERQPDGLTPSEQLVLTTRPFRSLPPTSRRSGAICAHPGEVGIVLVDGRDVTRPSEAGSRIIFLHNIFPLLTPLAIDPAHPFPLIPSLDLPSHCARADLRRQADEARSSYARKIDRFIRLPAEKDAAVAP